MRRWTRNPVGLRVVYILEYHLAVLTQSNLGLWKRLLVVRTLTRQINVFKHGIFVQEACIGFATIADTTSFLITSISMAIIQSAVFRIVTTILSCISLILSPAYKRRAKLILRSIAFARLFAIVRTWRLETVLGTLVRKTTWLIHFGLVGVTCGVGVYYLLQYRLDLIFLSLRWLDPILPLIFYYSFISHHLIIKSIGSEALLHKNIWAIWIPRTSLGSWLIKVRLSFLLGSWILLRLNFTANDVIYKSYFFVLKLYQHWLVYYDLLVYCLRRWILLSSIIISILIKIISCLLLLLLLLLYQLPLDSLLFVFSHWWI